MTKAVAGSALLGITFVATVVMYAPMPVFPLWMARLICKETALVWTVLALVAAVLIPTRGRRVTALICALLASLPLLLPLRTMRQAGVPFSLAQYATGVSAPDVRVERDVQVAPDRADLLADVYRAPQPGLRPFVVVIHGGSWRHGDKGEVPLVSRQIAAAGVTAIDVRYRLAPDYPFPAAPGDVLCLLLQAERLGVDPTRGALLGRSAGGHLALLAGYVQAAPADQAQKIPPSCKVPAGGSLAKVRAVVGIYSFVDMVYGHAHPPVPDPIDGPESIELFLGGTPAQKPAEYALATPTSWVKPGRALPPTLLIHGGSDALVRVLHSQLMDQSLRAAQQPVRLVEIPLADHGFDFRAGGVAEQLTRALSVEFLRTNLNP